MCTFCENTGSLSKDLDAHLDCTHCDVASERAMLEAWARQQRLHVAPVELFRVYQHGKQAALAAGSVA